MISDSLGLTLPIRLFDGEVREPMTPDKIPRYAVLIRWGTFRLDLVGRPQIIAAIMLLTALIGLKVFVF